MSWRVVYVPKRMAMLRYRFWCQGARGTCFLREIFPPGVTGCYSLDRLSSFSFEGRNGMFSPFSPIGSSGCPLAVPLSASVSTSPVSGVRIFLRNRNEGMKPSMAAHMDVISACRRALEWDHATKTYR